MTQANQGSERTGLPIYQQISEMLIRDIAAGRLTDGERLPPERTMSAQLKIAVGTLRRALEDLEEKGLLERVQGSGNYIRTRNLRDHFYSMLRIELLSGGGFPNARILSVDVMDKPADLPAFGTASRASRVRRLRFLDETPVAAEEIWLDASKGEVKAEDLEDSLYAYYQRALGFWIASAEDRVSFAPMPDWGPSELDCRPGETAGYIERFSWADGSAPVEFSRTWFDTSRAHYVQRMR
ncbi:MULTISPECIES: GntR family transcriptional regulator [unclassified Thioclava]|uniref:GntR family transcriptional regulator n=1 Tax=unclassified Thioclava TaxID=2621713 RepID=UPI000B547EA4|nr:MULTISPECIES: GntR family transcriptional regulator [unclassified Thioclava]